MNLARTVAIAAPVGFAAGGLASVGLESIATDDMAEHAPGMVTVLSAVVGLSFLAAYKSSESGFAGAPWARALGVGLLGASAGALILGGIHATRS